MSNRFLSACLFVFAVVLFIGSQSQVFGASTNIAFITDGPINDLQGGASPLVNVIKTELHQLTTGRDSVSFVDPEGWVGDWTRESVEVLVEKALNDKNIDMVIANGLIASRAILGWEKLSKPVFIPFVIEPSPEFVQSTTKGSGINNLYYVDLQGTFTDDVRIFQEILPFKDLTLLCGPSVRANGSMAEDFVEAARHGGTRVTLKVIDNTMESIDRLNLDTEAVMVLPMPQLSRIKMISLIKKINAKKIPSYAYVRRQYVEDGLMATYLPEHVTSRIGRRTALSIRKVIEGEKPENIATELEFERHVVLNVGTAKMIGVSPAWSVMADATLINEDQVMTGTGTLSLEEAVKESLMANLKVLAQDKYTRAAHEELRLARSALRPKINVGVNQSNIDQDRARVSFVHQQHEVAGTATFSALLMSEQARSGITVAQNLHRASLYELDDLRLDTALSTAVSYLNLLKYMAYEKIRKEDHRLTAASLKRAKDMVLAGSSRKTEEYRWESQVASSKSALYSAKTFVAQEKLYLNSLLNRDLTQEFETVSATVRDVFVHKVDKVLEKHIENAKAMAQFSDYMVKTAYEQSPLLKAISKNIDAQRRIYMAAKRSYHVPNISIYGDLNDVWSGSGAGAILPGSDGDIFEWSGGIRLDIPLTTGGERDAEKRRAARVLEQLTYQYDQSKLDVALGVRQSLESIRATRPIIDLTKLSAEAARKNYELVNEAYNAGAVSIIILIDAQSKQLESDQSAVSARYNHLIEVLQAQRRAGFFTFLMSDAEYKRWLTGAKKATSKGRP